MNGNLLSEAYRKQPLPTKQAAVLDFIKTELAAGASFPTMHRIATYMGWKSDQSARDCLDRLVYRGRLEFDRQTRRYSVIASAK